MKVYASYGQKLYPIGFMIDYYYVEEPAKVTGEYAIDTYTINGELYVNLTQYQLVFKPGWNIVKHQVAEVLPIIP